MQTQRTPPLRICRICNEEEVSRKNRSGICSKRKECLVVARHERYLASQKHNTCTQGGCRKPIAKGHKSLCERHRKKHNARMRVQNAFVRIKKGRCGTPFCKQPLAKNNPIFCEEHWDEYLKASALVEQVLR